MRLGRTASLCAWLVLALVGCRLPGRPPAEPEVPRPEEVLSFDKLYQTNCAGCHGRDGSGGPAVALSNPEYLAIVDDGSLRDDIAKGENGTLMPAFGNVSGGDLTDQQIEVIVRGMRDKWSKANVFAGTTPPPYRATRPADTDKGKAVYMAACAHCHGVNPQQPGPAGAILEGSFLALLNQQTIRTTILAGRPDVGQPDWRGVEPGHPLTDDEITDVSAWLIRQTPPFPGRPYPNSMSTSEAPDEVQPMSEVKR